ncbi:MAG TPA: UxaA family hydrolase [Candidatus Methylomirabilis sp.]|nr:UxaA family hydrolase [Candidatus Methylomirabilis sp.]
MQFLGYRRSDGSVGVRNHVAIVSTVLCSSPVTRRIAEAAGAMAITHEAGCGELGPEREHTERVLRGVVRHPNVGAVLVVGLGCEQIEPERLAQAVTDKPVRFLSIQKLGGPTATIAAGTEAAREMQESMARVERSPATLAELILATQCGGSDTGSGLASNPSLGATADLIVSAGGTVLMGETGGLYGAAGFLTRRTASPAVAERILEITDAVERHSQRLGKSIKEANPTPGNIAGGLTTLVEKALGGVRKGGTSLIQGVVKPAERVTGKGLWIMDTSVGIGACAMSDMLVGGAQILAYTTGRGNPLGSPLGPVIKITATQETAKSLEEIIDFDASPVLRDEETIPECGRRLLDEVLAVAGGKLTKAEKLGHYAFAIGRIAA